MPAGIHLEFKKYLRRHAFFFLTFIYVGLVLNLEVATRILSSSIVYTIKYSVENFINVSNFKGRFIVDASQCLLTLELHPAIVLTAVLRFSHLGS